MIMMASLHVQKLLYKYTLLRSQAQKAIVAQAESNHYTREVTLLKKIRLAIGVNDDYVEKTVEGIIAGARTGDIGDGKIFVLPMDECIRIRTGERGNAAIG